MDASEIQRYLHEQIPISAAMGVRVESANAQRVVLSAPLEPNINHRETVFGGSASALAILAAWSLVHVRLVAGGLSAKLVIQRNTVFYDRPIVSDFEAVAEFDDTQTWDRFVAMLERHGRARIRMRSILRCGGLEVGALEGDFVAFRRAGQ